MTIQYMENGVTNLDRVVIVLKNAIVKNGITSFYDSRKFVGHNNYRKMTLKFEYTTLNNFFVFTYEQDDVKITIQFDDPRTEPEI